MDRDAVKFTILSIALDDGGPVLVRENRDLDAVRRKVLRKLRRANHADSAKRWIGKADHQRPEVGSHAMAGVSCAPLCATNSSTGDPTSASTMRWAARPSPYGLWA